MSTKRKFRISILVLAAGALLATPASLLADKPPAAKTGSGKSSKAVASSPKASAKPPAVASEGTVTGTLKLNDKTYQLKYVYVRKREVWPSDTKALGVETVEDLPCGIVEMLFTNEPLPDATITAILHNEYQGSPTIWGARLISDGSGKHDWTTRYLLDTGSVEGFGMTDSSGSIETGGHYKGHVESRNQDVTKIRELDFTFDAPVKLQYSVTETESAQAIPPAALPDEFVKSLPGTWTIERFTGVGCWYATGTLEVGERTSPHEFQSKFTVAGVANGKSSDVEEDGVISLAGTKVHFEGGKITSEEKSWTKDDLDCDLWKDLLVCNTSRYSVVLKKSAGTASGDH
jgi:hypothetical protein